MEKNQRCRYFKGDIVDFVVTHKPTAGSKIGMRKKIESYSPYKLIILREIEAGIFLVAICKNNPRNTQISADTSCGTLYVKTIELFCIDAESLYPCDNVHFKKSKTEIVNEIYESHYREIDLQKQKRKSKLEKKKIRKEKKELEKIYGKLTEVYGPVLEKIGLGVRLWLLRAIYIF